VASSNRWEEVLVSIAAHSVIASAAKIPWGVDSDQV
jgi:hypothetical protein